MKNIDEAEVEDFKIIYKDKEINLDEKEKEDLKELIENFILENCLIGFDCDKGPILIAQMYDGIEKLKEEKEEYPDTLKFIKYLKKLEKKIEKETVHNSVSVDEIIS